MSTVNNAPSGVPQILKRVTVSQPANEFKVNSYTAGSQRHSSVTSLPDGGWLVTWSSDGQDGSGWGIYGQRYSSTGAIVGGEFMVNSYTAGSQRYSSVTSLPDGGWLVTWSSDSQDGSGWGIYGKRYNSGGSALGSEFQINSYTTDKQIVSSVTALVDGGWLVTWSSDGQDGSQSGIYSQRFSEDGLKLGAEFQVNTYTVDLQESSSVTALTDGGWLISWHSINQDGSSYGIYAQRFDSAGSRVGGEFLVNSYTFSAQTVPEVTALADGGWIITWTSSGQDSSQSGIYGQRYSQDGLKFGAEFQVNTYTVDQQVASSVSALSDGGWVISWMSFNQDGPGAGIYAQRYWSDGQPNGVEFLVNAYIIGIQGYPTVAGLPDGGWVITWSSDPQDGSNEGIFAQRFDAAGNKAYTYTFPAIVGSASDFTEGNTLYADASLIADTDGTGTVTWQWQRSTDGGSTWSDISSATGNSYTLAQSDVDSLVRLKGSYTDGGGTLETVYSLASTAIININDAPTIAFNSGSATAALNVAENSTAVTTVTATDVDANTTLSYSISGGADAALFEINAATGALSFKAAPNFEAPGDGGANNVYDVVVQVSDGALTDTQAIAVTITDVDDTAPTVSSIAYGTNDGALAVGETVTLSVTLSEAVNVTGTPTLALSNGGTATYTGGTGTNTLTFSYTAAAGQATADLATAASNALTGTIADLAGNAVTAAGFNNVNPTGTLAVDAAAPTFTSATTSADGLKVILTYNEPLNATTAAKTAFAVKVDGVIASVSSVAVNGSTMALQSEFQVNSTTQRSQYEPNVTTLVDGGWVVTWTSDQQDGWGAGIFGQRFDAMGERVGVEFGVNSFINGEQNSSKVAALKDGGWVVTWTSMDQDADFGGYRGIYGQRFDNQGNRQGEEFQVNTHTPGNQSEQAISSLADGGWYVVWWSSDQSGIYGQRYDLAGAKVGSETLIAANIVSYQFGPSIASLTNGGWVVTWHNQGPDGSVYGVFGQIYDRFGNTAGGPFQVNTYANSSQWVSSTTGLKDGSFVTVWMSFGQDGSSYGIYGQRFNSSGFAIGSEFQVNTYTQDGQVSPSVAALSDGGWIVAWVSSEGQDGSGAGTYAQRFDSGGQLVGSEFLVNTFVTGNQWLGSSTPLLDGGWITVWTSDALPFGGGQDGSSSGVFGQRYAVNGSTIELTMATAIVQGQAVTVGYTAPTASAATTNAAVQDTAGNDAATLAATTSVTNISTVDKTAPTVSTFSPTDGLTVITVGSNVVLTFSEAIARGTGTITLRSGSATGTIVESFDAATSNRLIVSDATLTIDPTNNLSANTQYFVVFTSGNIKDTAGNAYAGISTYDFRTAADTTGPTFTSATTSVDGFKVILTYNEPLSATTAAKTAFAVKVAGLTATVNSIAVNGSTIELTLATSIGAGQAVTVGYKAPTASAATTNAAVQDTGGNDAATLAATTAVTNISTADKTGPAFTSATTSVDGFKVILTYNEPLGAITAAKTAFAVKVAGLTATVNSIAVNGSTIELTMATAIGQGKAVTVGYIAPIASATTTNAAVQDVGGNDAATLSSTTAVTNISTADKTGPAFTSATTSVDGFKVILTYNEALGAITAARTAFAVKVAGVTTTVNSVAVNGSTVELTLATSIGTGQAVTVGYTAPTRSAATTNAAVQDIAGNDAATLTATTAVTNNSTVDKTAPLVSTFTPSDGLTGVAVGANIALTFSEAIERGTGSITLRSGSATGTIVESFNAATSNRIIVSDTTLIIDPTSNISANTQYFVVFTSGNIKDTAGNNYAGTRTYDFRTINIINGTATNNTLTGTVNADTINGLAGNDIITGGAGTDSMDGGEGSDLYIVATSADHAAPEFADTGTSGTDEVRFTSITAGRTLTLYAGDTGIEKVVIGTGTAAAAVTTATTALNINATALGYGITLTGNAGANVLTGGSGNDTLTGGAGNDVLDGGNGFDYADYTASTTAITVNLSLSTAQITGGAGSDRLVNIEGLIGGSTADRLTGNAADNILIGLGGNDTISGGDGFDQLRGGTGNDTLTGGTGIDWFIFDTTPNATTNKDTITDFMSGTDKLLFSKAIFTGLSDAALGDLSADAFWSGAGVTTAQDADDRFIYNTTTGALYYDADGNASGSAAVLVAMLGATTPLAFTDLQIIG